MNRNKFYQKFVFLAFFCVPLLFCGCGYQIGRDDGLSASYPTISVPYVIGDKDGTLTSAIVKEVVRFGYFTYKPTCGSLILNVKVVDLDEENIGFRYDRKKRGNLTKDIVPTEVRVTIVVEIWVTDPASCATLLGPVLLSASVDYDHDYYSSRNRVNITSLGQLTDYETASDAVQVPLNRAIAEKIVEYISQSW